MKNYKVIIGTCLYYRADRLQYYMESLFKNTPRDGNWHVYLVLNYDDQWPKHMAIDDINYALNSTDWASLGMTHREAKDYYDLLPMPNMGLKGFNIPLEISRSFGYMPTLLVNDDAVFPSNWTKLLHMPTEAVMNTPEDNLSLKMTSVDPEKIGCIGPVYKEPGSMRNQQYDPNKNHISQTDFVVGHCQLITPQAIKKGFRFKDEICEEFGPFDIAQAVTLQHLEMNMFINRGVCFDFHESKESHFHCGDPNRFLYLAEGWQRMAKKLEVYQQEHIKKHGFNKWAF